MNNHKLLIVNNSLFAILLICTQTPAPIINLTNIYFCVGLTLVLMLLDLRISQAVANFKIDFDCSSLKVCNWKLKGKVLAFSMLVPAVLLVGAGPVATPPAYELDSFNRIFGIGLINDCSISKRVHYFYFSLIIYSLLVFGFYQSIRLALLNNQRNKISRLIEFADTLLLVGYSFLLICAYRQFSNLYRADLSLYLLKSFVMCAIPLFYLWQIGKLRINDIRAMLAFILFSLVLSVCVVLYLDTRYLFKFSEILTISLCSSIVLFLVNSRLSLCRNRIIYSKLMYTSSIGAVSLVFFSISYEFFNILALKTGKFLDVEKFNQIIFILVCIIWLVVFILPMNTTVGKKTTNACLFIFVLGVSLIQFQPAIVFFDGISILETANYAVPISDFFNFNKIPLFENFPGHGLNGVISSLAYGFITSDYLSSIFMPWRTWLYSSVCIIILYCFVKRISNGLAAISCSLCLPYFVIPNIDQFTSFCGIGLVVILPYIHYLRTFKRQYLILTVLLSSFLVAYKLDIGFAYFVGIIGSSFCVSFLYRNKIIYSVLFCYGLTVAAVFVLFLFVCLIKDLNPIYRIQEFLSVISSNDHHGLSSLGDTEKNTYSFVYFALPLLSIACLFITVIYKDRLSVFQFAVSLCLLFAYFANFPRFLVMHSLAQYWAIFVTLWLWTMPFAIAFLMSRLLSSRSLFILILTAVVLTGYILFQPTTFYDESPLQNALSRADQMSAEVSPEVRKANVDFVYNRKLRFLGREDEHLFHAKEIAAITDLLLSQDETFVDFTNMSAAYALSRKESPVYVTQSPAMLSDETAQKFFIAEIEEKISKVPIAIMPANENWCQVMTNTVFNNNIWEYLLAEWIYNNYRPFIKYNNFASVWVLNSRYDEFYNKLNNADLLSGNTFISKALFPYSLNQEQTPLLISLIDWGYDSVQNGDAASTDYISNAHDYSIEFLPFLWGQFDYKHAADRADLTKVSWNGDLYSWNYTGHEKEPAYLRVELSLSSEFVKATPGSYFTLGTAEDGKYYALSRFKFRLREGKNVYLFRISSDYYWSRGKLNAMSLDPTIASFIDSVRILQGD